MPLSIEKIILIVDDNRDAADALAILVSHCGCRASVAYDVESGLSIAHEISPDIILHDINLPIVDGYAAVRSLRSDAKFDSTIIVAVTALDATPDRKRCKLAGFVAHG